MSGPIDPKAFSKIAALSDDFGYSVPGATDTTYTIVGGFIPDDPGQILVERGEPFWTTLRFEPAYRWSLAWWLSAWMPEAWRVWLCDRYGHPSRSVGYAQQMQSVATSQSSDGCTFSVELEALGPPATVERWCVRCGRDVSPSEGA